METLRLFLERNAQSFVFFFACLLGIFVVIRPLSRVFADYLHRRPGKEAGKNGATLQGRPLDRETEQLLDEAGRRGMTDQERIRRLAQSNPDKAKDIVRSWLHGGD